MFDEGGTKSTIIFCRLDADLEAVKTVTSDYHYVHALLSSDRAKKKKKYIGWHEVLAGCTG